MTDEAIDALQDSEMGSNAAEPPAKQVKRGLHTPCVDGHALMAWHLCEQDDRSFARHFRMQAKLPGAVELRAAN
eukprot:m.52010 g.52010  ORF g.52010 m.52010 type:complete len:74 (+) comp11277_c0_seq4:174-395(+)